MASCLDTFLMQPSSAVLHEHGWNMGPSEPVVGVPDAFNKGCFCLTLDEAALAEALDSELAGVQLSELVRQRCPYVFAARPVFVEASGIRRMTELIQAVESVVALPA